MDIDDMSKFLGTHNGRDKVIRTLSYATKLAAAFVSSEETARKLDSISGQLSACRTILRLFDDIPMLNYTLTYGLGKEEPDKLTRIIGILINAADQLYFPLEHVAWASDHRIVSLRSTSWWTACTVCWAVSLYLSFIKALRCMHILQYQRSCLNGTDSDANAVMTQLVTQQRHQLLTVLRCGGDLAQAVNCLPGGFLWAGKLQKWHCGALGTITSIISLYQSYQRIVANQKTK
ncbi:peroxisomal membrane protein 11C isoform X1 [Zootermopsis nevadensis]|uniref:peroxisomal membrane protein 11C isoform X1 n=1 Tax=Zootermopsis nevadensis TaxID=136037 RepID=UPI000B8E2A53|nr:peroxisomal membrane protein 11C isoform X1 [Zootermopsis nevadensis]